MPDYLLFYDYGADAVARRAAVRREHLTLAWESIGRGHLVMGGAYADPVDGAVLHFRCDSRAPVEQFVREDPYVRSGVVTAWKIREWNTVAGRDALKPLRPEDL